MRLAIVGSREINNPEILMTELKKVPHLEQVTEIVSGGANGIDSLAKQYAEENGLKLTEFLPYSDVVSYPVAVQPVDPPIADKLTVGEKAVDGLPSEEVDVGFGGRVETN